MLRGSEQKRSFCHRELEPGRGDMTNTLGTVHDNDAKVQTRVMNGTKHSCIQLALKNIC